MNKPTFYVNYLKWIMVLSGTWPILFCLISVTNFTLQIPVSISNGQYEKITENIGYIIINNLSVFRLYIINKPEMQNLICELVEREERIITGENEEIWKIWKKCSRVAGWMMNALVGLAVLTFLAFSGSHYITYIRLWDETQTTSERRMMFGIWLPINQQDHYIGVLFYEIILLAWVAVGYLATQHFSVIMMVFICGNLKVLQHFLTNVKKYSSLFAEIEDENERILATFRMCVIEHQNIISFTDRLNNSMKIICFLEFSTNSLQLAAIFLQSAMMIQNPVTLMIAVALVLTTNTQMLTSYSFANEIIIESQNVADAVYEWDWYNNNSKKIATVLQFVMRRAQRNLALTIGPFGDMSLRTALKICKGVFTYIRIIQQFTEEQ